jgi:hypothetical protein
MKYATAIALACAVVLGGIVSAQVDDPAPTPIAFTPEPKQLQWRIGFDLGNALILEAPELNPENDFKLAVREAERVLPDPWLAFGLALLPASKVRFQQDRLVNPRQWTIVDLQGKTNSKTFQGLGIFMGRRMTSTEGGYHLVSLASLPSNAMIAVRREPSPEDLILAFAGPSKAKIDLRKRLAETKWENLLPVEDPASLPAGYLSAKQLLDDGATGTPRFLYGTSIEALIQKRVTKLWLLNYSHPDTSIGKHPWGIFAERAGALEALYIYSPAGSGDPYLAYFTAAADLNQDGTDELIIEASYRAGTAYKVISNSGGKYREIFTSYYRGPAS